MGIRQRTKDFDGEERGEMIGLLEECEEVFEQIEAILPDLEERPATKGVARKLRAILGLPEYVKEPTLCTGQMVAFWEGPYTCSKCSHVIKLEERNLLVPTMRTSQKHEPVLPLKGPELAA